VVGQANKAPSADTAFRFVLCLAAAVGLIAGAFHLVFKRDEKAT
jgi:hypothetical protein